MIGATQGVEHRARVSTALTLVAYADSAAHDQPSHAATQVFTFASHLADRHGGLDEDDLASDLVSAGWHQHDDAPLEGTRHILGLIASGMSWWSAARGHHERRDCDPVVRATAAGFLPGALINGVAQLARRSTIVTHNHPDVRDAAAVQAGATAMACAEQNAEYIDISKYLELLSAQCRGRSMAGQLAVVGRLASGRATAAQARTALGDSTAAPAAAAAALTGFLRHPGRPLAAIAWLREMGAEWHASALMAAALAGAACPQARPPLTWSADTGLTTRITAIATTLATCPAPLSRRLNRAGRPAMRDTHFEGLSHKCHGSGETMPHRLGSLTVREGHI